MKKVFGILILLIVLSFGAKAQQIGAVADNYNGVPIYVNGHDYVQSHGKSFAADGYYLGQKWQCVEFVKRYFYTKFSFKFPVWGGNANEFMNFVYNQGELNKERNCYQYYNGDNEKPQVDDILVFSTSRYGHVCIVSKVEGNTIEVVQQNIEGKPRVTYTLTEKNGKYFIANGDVAPIGFLRVNKAK